MSSALVKTSNVDQEANFLMEKITSTDGSVTINETTISGKKILDIKSPGGGVPAGIVLGMQITGVDYTLNAATKNLILITDPTAIISLPAASSFQEAVEYIIKDVSGNASENNILIQCAPGDYFEGDLAEILLTENYQYIKFVSDLSQYFLITSKA